MKHFDCHPKQAFFAQREPALSLPKGIWASRAKCRVLCDTIIARLARFLINSRSLQMSPP
jgi:hypothetical protein